MASAFRAYFYLYGPSLASCVLGRGEADTKVDCEAARDSWTFLSWVT